MEASCYLGESSYEVLHDMISSSMVGKAENTQRINIGRAEVLERIVFQDSSEIMKLCDSCLMTLGDVLSQTEKVQAAYTDQYDQTLRHFSYTDSSRRHFDEEHVKGLIDDILEAERECKRLLQEDRNHTLQVDMLQQEISELDRQICETTMDLNSLDYSSRESQESLARLMSVTATAENELEHLSMNPMVSVFSIQRVSLSPPAPGSLPQVSHSQGLLAINGLRVAFSPLSTENLNWAEICAAWSCLCTAVLCWQNEESLLGATQTQAGDNGTENGLFSYRIVPLRGYAILVEHRQRAGGGGGGHSDKRLNCSDRTDSPEEFFELLCSHNCDDPIVFTDEKGVGGGIVGEAYVKALVALAVVVVEMAVFAHRPDVLSQSCQLQGLLGLAMGAGGTSTPTEDIQDLSELAWPSVNSMMASRFTSRVSCVQLVDELMSAIPMLLNISF